MVNEEFHCEKCGIVFSMQVQNNGKFDYDDGTGCCEVMLSSSYQIRLVL